MSGNHRKDILREIRNIGYSDTFDVKGRTLHVQTEVTAGQKVRIKTIVIEGGVVLDSIVRTSEQMHGDVIARTREAAKLQHDMVVREVVDGKYD